MQILIATQGVTPNSVEINTNCVLPGNCSLSDLPSLARRFYITSAPRGTFTYSLLSPRPFRLLFSIPPLPTLLPTLFLAFSPIVQLLGEISSRLTRTKVRETGGRTSLLKNYRNQEGLGGIKQVEQVDSKDQKLVSNLYSIKVTSASNNFPLNN